jgi:hypothetical protein
MKNRSHYILAIFISLIAVPAFSQQVSPGGAFNYRVPIEIPPGTNGMAPELALVYDSGNENGILGVGWSIEGLSCITRDASYPINFDDSDHYLYNGQKLIYNSSDKIYHLEKDDYTKIEGIGVTIGSQSNINYWRVYLKNGTRLEYGMTADSRIDAVGKSGFARLWALSKVADSCGNYYTVTYSEDTTNGDYYPSQIQYTLSSRIVIGGPTISKYRTIDFGYLARSDVFTRYIPTKVTSDKILDTITVKADTYQVRKYKLVYGSGTGSGYNRLTSVKEYGSDGASFLPVTSFTYSDGTRGIDDSAMLSPLATNMYWDHSIPYTGDFNGDGMADLLVYYANPSNGRYELYRWWGTSSGVGAKTLITDALTSASPTHVGDFNGDGKDDLIGLKSDSSTSWRMSAYWATVTGFDFVENYKTYTSDTALANYRFLTSDLNGDGCTDLIAFQKITDTSIYVWWGSSTGLGNKTLLKSYVSSTWNSSYFEFLTGDFDGDGRTDIFAYPINAGGLTQMGPYTVWYGTSSGISANTTVTVPSSSTYNWQGCKYNPGDVNGDGRTDLLAWDYESTYCSPPAHLSTPCQPIFPRLASQVSRTTPDSNAERRRLVCCIV